MRISPSGKKDQDNPRHTDPEFSVRLGGATSIDVTKPGIDKAYGIKKLQETLGISVKEMIYVGDALFVGGNDYPAEQAVLFPFQFEVPNETKRVIEAINRLFRTTVNRRGPLRWQCDSLRSADERIQAARWGC